MPFKKGQSGNPKGKPKGAKSKICDSFYEDWLIAYSDPRIGRSEGLIKFALASAHNMAIFLGWGARTMPSNVNLGNAPDADGTDKEFVIRVIHVNDGDGHEK